MQCVIENENPPSESGGKNMVHTKTYGHVSAAGAAAGAAASAAVVCTYYVIIGGPLRPPIYVHDKVHKAAEAAAPATAQTAALAAAPASDPWIHGSISFLLNHFFY